MIIIPAIDIIDQKPVRLYQGDYNQKEIVGESIEELAKTFEALGATSLHLVDLDGAKEGSMINHDIIKKVANSVKMSVDVGGGIRSIEAIKDYLDNGLNEVILGTSALEDEVFLKEALALYGEKIVVGIDAKDGMVYGRGWLSASEVNYLDFAKRLEKLGVKKIIVTDISKDGTLSGPNVEMYKQLKANVKMKIVASGGIKSIEDIKALKDADIYGAITGKAIYHKTLDLKEAIKVGE